MRNTISELSTTIEWEYAEMKIRWTKNSLRYRITPTELESLQSGVEVLEEMNGVVSGWKASIVVSTDHSIPRMTAESIVTGLTRRDISKLSEEEIEGIYFVIPNTSFQYMIEKDFPCIHPKGAEVLETQTETFPPPPDFETRKI